MIAPFNFAIKAFGYDDSDSPSRNNILLTFKQATAYLQPAFDNIGAYIAGTRSTGTRFTRTAGTWTADELIGKYLVALDADSSHIVFTIHKIADNATTTVDISATWGNAALVASADTILIYDTLDEVMLDVAWGMKA